MELIDTHCHIHDSTFFSLEESSAVIEKMHGARIKTILLVGTSLKDSQAAIKYADNNPKNCRAIVGIHPHEAAKLTEMQIKEHLEKIAKLSIDRRVVAIGECGLDFYYNDRSKLLEKQEILLRGHLKIAEQFNLPLSFHVREAFDDFWPIFDSFKKIRGVLHSFTDTQQNLEMALQKGLYIGVNGIATFTTKLWQRDLYKDIPLNRLLLETDAPFLTPKPLRGKINTPENVIYITKYLAELRGEDASYIAKCTTANARKLFGIS